MKDQQPQPVVVAKERTTHTGAYRLGNYMYNIGSNLRQHQRIVPLYCSVFNEEPWNDDWTEEAAFERLLTFCRIPRFDGLVMSIDGKPMAMVLGWEERWSRGWMFLIKDMCVDVSLRRSGMGKELMSTFENGLIEKGFAGAYLEMLGEGAYSDFYAALNFDRIPLVILRKRFGQRRIWMVRPVQGKVSWRHS